MSEEQDKKKKRRLRDITFEKSGNHIALVGPIVGGPANGVQTILWKSKATDDISEEEVKQLLEKASGESERLGETEVEKAKFNSEVREMLSEKVREKFAGKYEWLYLEDFSDSQIVFSSDAGMFIVDYSLSSDDEYTFGETAIGVEYKSILVEKGAVKLSADAQEELSEGVYSLLSKALDNPETSQRVEKQVGVSLEKAKEKMQEEIQKAVDAVLLQKQAEIDAIKEELVKAQEVIAKVEAEKKEAVLKARQEAVAQFDKEGAEALVKATAELADEAFETIVKALQVKHEALEQSDLFKQASQQGSDKQEEESATVALLKARK